MKALDRSSHNALFVASWLYIIGYECLRGLYVAVLMPMAAGTFSSIVGLMIGSFVVLVAATLLLPRRPQMALGLAVLYVVLVCAIWSRYQIPTVTGFIRDRSADLLLLVGFCGAYWAKYHHKAAHH
jgi:hypothetical protein